jgi:hypothetical protein
LKPDYFEPMLNLARQLQSHLGAMSESRRLLERALALRPQDADARFLHGLALLTLGDLKQGFLEVEYERHRKDTASLHPDVFTQPEWSLDSPPGKTVLLHSEQGLGDTIQFLRYVPMVAARGARVIVACQKALVSLAATVEGAAEAVEAGRQTVPRFDLRASLVSLPRILGTTLETVPAKVPYLRADSEKVKRWAELLGERRGLRVGVVWAGNPSHANDKNRTMHRGELGGLAGVANVTFHSLQKGHAGAVPPPPPQGLNLVDHVKLLEDFSETAALIEALDLVISVDTSVVHLAGAMAKPVWVLLPKVPDWRWLLERSDSPWYPTMKLWRQDVAGDWGGVVEKVKAALDETTRTPSSRYSGERAGERG